MVIYKTTNIINGKIYVGKDAGNRNYYLGSGLILHKAIKKYGKENFKKEILEQCNSLEELSEKEIYWINKLNSNNELIGYNITKGGTGGDTISFNPNIETIKEKARQKSTGRKHSEETKIKLSELKKGIKFSEKHKYNLKQNHKGFTGMKLSGTAKEILRQQRLSLPDIICPYCGLVSKNKTCMNRWHFNNCKNKV